MRKRKSDGAQRLPIVNAAEVNRRDTAVCRDFETHGGASSFAPPRVIEDGGLDADKLL
jgi:hypothetical protein